MLQCSKYEGKWGCWDLPKTLGGTVKLEGDADGEWEVSESILQEEHVSLSCSSLRYNQAGVVAAKVFNAIVCLSCSGPLWSPGCHFQIEETLKAVYFHYETFLPPFPSLLH